MEKPTQVRPINQRRRLLVIQMLGLLLVPLVLMSYPAWPDDSIVFELFELVGMTLLLLGIFGRLWSILYSGNKKNVELVVRGPYSTTRNPLYFFSSLCAFGIGLLFGSLILSLLIGGMTTTVLFVTARAEAQFLRTKFGGAYEAYAASTPFFVPAIRLYSEVDTPTFDPKALRRTFRDALAFLAVIPVVETVEYLRQSGLMPDIFPLL